MKLGRGVGERGEGPLKPRESRISRIRRKPRTVNGIDFEKQTLDKRDLAQIDEVGQPVVTGGGND